jgi:hypothetical protein
MALCKNCPALKEGFAGIERYDFGTGCPDDDHDVYGGDCISMHRSNDHDHCPDCGGEMTFLPFRNWNVCHNVRDHKHGCTTITEDK